MKKNDRKALREKLVLAIKKQLLENNAEVSGKFEKYVNKSIKQIVKKARKRKALLASKITVAPEIKKPISTSKKRKVVKTVTKSKK